MKTKLIKKYKKHFILFILVSLNVYITLTPNGISIGVREVKAQSAEGAWYSGVEWFENFMDFTNGYPGVYEYIDGEFIYAGTTPQAFIDFVCYGVDLSHTPVNWGLVHYGVHVFQRIR